MIEFHKVEMTEQNTIDLEDDNRKDESNPLNDGFDIKQEAKRLGIDPRKYDIDYLIENSPFKTYNPKEIHDWSRYRIFSLMQMPSHPSYGTLFVLNRLIE